MFKFTAVVCACVSVPLDSIWDAAWRQQFPKIVRDGTHRAAALEHTLKIASGYAAKIGITRVANVTGLDYIGIPVVMVVRPNSRNLSVSQGKGLSLVAAKVSGIMESIESYAAESVDSVVRYETYRAIKHLNVVDVDQLPRPISSTWTVDSPMLWVKGHDFLPWRETYVPLELVHTNYTLPLPPASGSFDASSNGLASGNNVLEALSHALCEVIERHNMATWLRMADWDGSAIDLDTVADANCKYAIDKFRAAGFVVSLFDTSCGFGVPSFLCLVTDSLNEGVPLHQYALGAGSHLNRDVAALRALTEAAQSRLTVISGSRDDLSPTGYQKKKSGESRAPAFAHVMGSHHFATIQSHDFDTINDDVEYLLGALRNVGIEQIIGLDLTPADCPLSIVRVVVPGLEGLDESAAIPAKHKRAAS
jgi:YcaO-like protein with predicted kinase domain